MTATAGTDGTGAQSSDTPSSTNVSDETTAVVQAATNSSGNDNSASTPATPRSDDTRGAGYDFTKLLDNLDSLPERVANAVREAAAPVTPNPATAPATTSTNDTGNAAGRSGETGNSGDTVNRSRSERFAGWWFGK